MKRPINNKLVGHVKSTYVDIAQGLSKFELALRGRIPNINYSKLQRICRKRIRDFHNYGEKFVTPDGVYYYKDNGSDILAVAHLDSVQGFHHFSHAKLKHDTKIFCTNLDDRLGAYLILDYLPNLGLEFDILLTEGEEKGASTALHFLPPAGKKYKWMFQFDRIGTGCVMYQYRSYDAVMALRDAGIELLTGSFSDISSLGHLGCRGFNFGTGYHLNHSPEAYASINEIKEQIQGFVQFYEANRLREFEYIPPVNSFSFVDGFTYDPKVKEANFSIEEYKLGIKLMNDAELNKSLSKAKYDFTFTKSTFNNIKSPSLFDKTDKVEEKSEKRETFKMGVGIVNHPDPTSGKTAVEIQKEAQSKGKSALIVDRCPNCGEEFTEESVGNMVITLCSKCRRIKMEASTSRKKPEPTKLLDTSKVGSIKTKIPLNLGGVPREYRIETPKDETKEKRFVWVQKLEVGFQQPVTK